MTRTPAPICLLACAIVMAGPRFATGAGAPPGSPIRDLSELSIEDLVNVEVTSVSRQREQLVGAASAIEAITQEEIHRYGAFNLPEALELSTGLQVARGDVQTWAITARGFNTSIANKMQVMIDGRLLYTPLYSGIFWDAQNVLMEDLSRIEIVRGPGATLWGSNAVNGVISIISKEASETQGWFAQVGAGDFHEAFGSVRYGGKLSDSTHYRVYFKSESDDPLPTLGGPEGQDPRSFAQGGFRVDSYLSANDQLTVQGDAYEGEHGIDGAPDATISGSNVLARWSRIVSVNLEMDLRVYFDSTHRDLPGSFGEDRDSYDLDFQYLYEDDSGNSLVWGFNYHYSTSDIDNGPELTFEPPHRITRSYSAFAQYQRYWIPDTLGTIIGAKLEDNTLGGEEFQPSVRVFWRPQKNATLWGAVSRAARKPTQIDTDLVVRDSDGDVIALGNPDFRSESVIAYELGWRSKLLRNLSVDLALFRNDYDDVRSLNPDPETFLPVRVGNTQGARSSGAELTLHFKLAESWVVQAGAATLDFEYTSDPGTTSILQEVEANDPDHWYHIRSSWDIDDAWTISGMIRHVGSLPNPAIPSHTDLDLNLIWRATPDLELALTGRNLLDPAHPEFGSQPPSAIQVPRHVSASATWRF